MRYLIALVKLAGDEFAYHYATDNVDALIAKKAELRAFPKIYGSFLRCICFKPLLLILPAFRKWIHILRQLRKSRRFRNLPSDYKNIQP